jgi:two-component system cell cycle sensor histidine kinase/response regulator CckA
MRSEGADPSEAKRATVLLAEDELGTRRALAALLRRKGFTVIEATNGDEAIAHIAGPEPELVVVSDCGMPGATIGQIIKAAQTNVPPRKIILTSGYSAEALRQRGEPLANLPFLAKPFPAAELVSKIESVLASA